MRPAPGSTAPRPELHPLKTTRPELDGILSERFVKKGDFMVAPPQFADPSLNYDGYRAGIIRVRGSWKFAYFVNG